MDLGACPKSHTERLKTEFQAARDANPNDPVFNQFQNEYERNIFSFVDECDRRIRAAHRRLEKTPEENAKTTNLVCHGRCVLLDAILTNMQMREIAEIELAIQGGTEKIEQLGEQGKVEESMREMAAIEALKSEKTDKEVSSSPFSSLRRLMTLCRTNSNNLQTRQEHRVTKNYECVKSAGPICRFSTRIGVSQTISVVKCV